MNNDRAEPERTRRDGVLQEPAFQDYIQIILRGKWIILVTFLLVMAGTAIFTFTMDPVYESSASVLVDTKGQQSGLPLFDVTGMGTVKNIKNELEILKSRVLADAVAQKLIERGFADEGRKEKILLIQASTEGTQGDSVAPVSQIVRRLGSAVSFDPVRDSDVIKITAKSTNPREAALLANTYAEAYYDRNLLASRTRSHAVREFLEGQLKSRQQTLATSEDTLQQYMQRKGIVSLDDESKKIIDQLSALEATRDADEINIESLSKTLSSYEEELKKVEPNVSRVMGEANDPYIRQMQEQLAKLEVQRDVTIAQNPNIVGQTIYNDKLKEIDGQIVALREKLQKRTDEYLKSLLPGQLPTAGASDPSAYMSQIKQKIIELRIQRQSLVAKKSAMDEVIRQYEQQFNQIPAKSIEFARLQRNRLSNEKLYLLVEEKFNQAAIKEKSEFGYIDIIDPAIVAAAPVSPKISLNLLLGAVLGLGLGIGFVFLREHIDVRVRTPEDLKKRGFTTLTAPASAMKASRMRKKARCWRMLLRARSTRKALDKAVPAPTAPRLVSTVTTQHRFGE
jgi:tyrosine-protein kinase Etk/Wzc